MSGVASFHGRGLWGYAACMKQVSAAVTLMLALVVGCSAELKSDLTIDGAGWKPSGCDNGVQLGYRGVALSGPGGRSLRIAATMTDQAQVVLITNGAEAQVIESGSCGQMRMADQNSTINGVKNVEGKATLDCSASGVTIKGTITFGNCH